jgi:hypothetical protein
MDDNRLTAIERDLTVLMWMVGSNVGLTLIVRGSLVGLVVRLLSNG